MMKYPAKGVADQLATHGRYGDSVLVHMNPVELQGIAAMAPGGKLTKNPVTGQPEAFLPFLAPMLGSWLGTTFLGTTLGSGLAGAIGSGLATTAITGDLKKGIAAGITGFGLGKILGAGAEAASGLKPAVDAAQTGVSQATANLGNAAAEMAKSGQGATMGMGDYIKNAMGSGNFTPEQANFLNAAKESTAANAGLRAINNQMAQSVAGQLPTRPMTNQQRLMAPFSKQGIAAMGNQLRNPAAMIPITTGMGQYAQLETDEANRDLARQKERDKYGNYLRNYNIMQGGYNMGLGDYGIAAPRR